MKNCEKNEICAKSLESVKLLRKKENLKKQYPIKQNILQMDMGVGKTGFKDCFCFGPEIKMEREWSVRSDYNASHYSSRSCRLKNLS